MMFSRRAVACLVLIGCMPWTPSASADSVRIFALSADTWAQPRAGQTLPRMEPVRAAVEYWGQLDQGVIKLSYPGEDSGELWASELHDWLVSLGVPSALIELAPGLQTTAELRILVGYPEDVDL
jgi:hypothetical protein